MIVLDTSAAVELLLALPHSPRIIERLHQAEWQVAAPQLLTVEILQVLRRRVAAGLNLLETAEQGLELLAELNIEYFEHQVLVTRMWQLRGNLSAYDASFVALAESLDAELMTADAHLARAPGHQARVLLLE